MMKIPGRGKDRNSLAVSYALTVSGESAQALFHLLLNVVLIREFLTRDYGVFAIIFTVGAIAILNVNAIFSQPIAVFIPRARGRRALALEVTMGSMALLACAAFAVVVALAAAVSLHDAATGVIAGGFAGLWPLRFYVKAVNFARHGKRGALRSAISDLFYAAASAFSLALLHFGFSVALTLASVFASLCVGNIVGVLICVAGSGRPIRIQFRPRTFLGFARLWPDIRWSLVGTVSATILQQSQMGFVTLMAGPAAFAPIAAGFVLMSPIRILTLAVMNIMRPDLSRSNAKGDHRSAGSVVERTSSALFVLCLIHGMMLWLCWPLLQSLLFAKRFGVQPMGEIVTLAWLLTSISNGTQILQASALAKSQFREAAWPTLAGGALTLLLVPAFLLAAGAPLSTAGAIIGEIVTLYLLWARRATAPSPVVRVTERRTVLRSVNQIPQ